MPIPQKITKYLEAKKLKYKTIKHKTVYTAFDKAATLKVPEKIVGKTLVIRLDRGFAFVLIPANKNLDKNKLKKNCKAKTINFVKEAWMKKKLKGVKIGAVPPFGAIFKLPIFVDSNFLKNPEIIINSGDYNWSIKTTPANFKKATPDLIIGNFSKPR